MTGGKVTLRETPEGVLIEVRVRTNANRFALALKEGRLILEVTSPPREGEANAEIVKELKRATKKDVEIVSGFKSKDKVLLIRGAKAAGVERIIVS